MDRLHHHGNADAEGKQRRCRPKHCMAVDGGEGDEADGKGWGGIRVMAKDPQMKKDYVAALHAAWNNGARVSQ